VKKYSEKTSVQEQTLEPISSSSAQYLKAKDLVQVIEHFNQVTLDFKAAYEKLEARVAELNLELEQKNAELSLSLREVNNLKNYLDNILESMSAGVICTDLEGRITLFNRAAEKITGYSTAQVMGVRYLKLMGKENLPKQTPMWAIQKGKNIVNQQKHILSRDGVKIPIKSSICLLRDGEGKISGAVEVFEDQRELRQLEQQVQHARTLAALGEMAGNVAHSIRNPLGAIGGFATLLERDLAIDDPRRRWVQKIIEAIGNLDKIVSNLLFLTRPIEPNFRLVNLKTLVSEVISHFEVQTEENENKVNIQAKFPRSKVELELDPQLFQQMLLHLVRNALQAMSAGGELQIVMRRKPPHRVQLVLQDTGGGIPSQVQKRMYFPFTTTKKGSVGLGLAIVRKIVEIHHGDIRIETGADKGTTICLEFPVTQ